MKNSAILILFALLVSACAVGTAVSQTDPRHVASVESLRERARNDDIDAIYLLVEMVTEFSPRYEKEAEFWLRRAALLGDKQAPRMLAEMLLLRSDDNGFEEAIAILKQDYKPGDLYLAKRIGEAYADKGWAEEAIGWLQVAATGGNFESVVDLSNMYANVERIKSAELSSFWACKAISMRDDDSFIIGKMRDRVKRYEKVCPSR